MSELETKSPAPANGSGDNECLQKQLNILLVGLIVLSATVGVFLWRQVHYLRKDLEATRPLYNAMMQSMAQERPVVDAFAAKLADYARKHKSTSCWARTARRPPNRRPWRRLHRRAPNQPRRPRPRPRSSRAAQAGFAAGTSRVPQAKQ